MKYKRNLIKFTCPSIFKYGLLTLAFLNLVSCSSINQQQSAKIETLTQRITELETQYKQDQQAIANFKQKEADLDLLIDVISQQNSLTGFKTVNDNQAQIIKIKQPKPLAQMPAVKKITPEHNQTTITNTTAKTTSATPPAFAVQIASLTSKQQSQQAWNNFKLKFPDLSQTATPILESVNKDNINFIRLKIGPYSKAKALKTCTFLKQNQQNCLLKKYTGEQF